MKPEMVVWKTLLKRNGLRRSLVKRVSNRLMMSKLHIDKRTVAVVSAYAPQQDVITDEKDRFYENIIQSIASISKKGIYGYH